MKLNVLTRLVLLNNLPEQGNMEAMINKRNVRNKIIFNSEELDKLKLETTDNGVRWVPIDPVDVNFTDTEIMFIKNIIDDLDSKNLISEDLVDFIIEINDIINKQNK
jgi:hypothetical protein